MEIVTKVEDDFVKHQMRWVVVLSNGETVYQDDNRPGLDEPSAWLRLKQYVADNNLNIIEFWLQFRTNRVLVEPRAASGYYFSKSAFGVWGEESKEGYVAGALVDGRVVGMLWKVPELIAVESINREVPLDAKPLILNLFS